MDSKPLNTSGIFNRKLAKALLIAALSLTFVVSLVYYMGYTGLLPVFPFNKAGFEPSVWYSLVESMKPQNWAHVKARTLFISTIIVAEATLVLSIRRMNQSLFASLKSASSFAYFMVFFVPIIHVLLMYVPPLQYLLNELIGINIELIQLTFYDWVICLGAGLTPILFLELYKRKIRKQNDFF
jgi:magnesium-transporting ATPase (P-type)